MEIADVFVINKADREGVERTARDLQSALEIDEAMGAWLPPIVKTVASLSRGIEDLVAAIEAHRAHLESSGELEERRRDHLRLRVEMVLKDRVLAAASEHLGLDRGGRARLRRQGRSLHRRRPRLHRRHPAGGGLVIGKIAHVGIAVRSIDESRGVWEALGLRIEAIEDVPHEGVRVAFLACGESHIELLEPFGADSPIAKFLDKRGPGHPPPLPGERRRARRRCRRSAPPASSCCGPEPTRGAGGCWVQFVHPKSAGGVLLEISQEE